MDIVLYCTVYIIVLGKVKLLTPRDEEWKKNGRRMEEGD